MARSEAIRIGTTKVKTGCVTCKERRVKCDEGRPCQKCLRSGRACSYAPHDLSLKVVQYGRIQPRFEPTLKTKETNQQMVASLPMMKPPPYTDKTLAGYDMNISLRTIGGLGTDPFDALPIHNTPEVQIAWDNLRALQLVHMDERPRVKYIKLMLNDPMFFETMITFSKVALRHNQNPQERFTVDIRTHVARILEQLRARLQHIGRHSTETTVLTIYYLLAVYEAANEHEAFSAHLAGLRQLYIHYSTHDTNFLDGFITVRVKSAELVAAFRGTAVSASPQRNSVARSNSPTPPLSPEKEISHVPAGFQDLVSSGRVSPSGVSFLRDIEQYLGRRYDYGSLDWRITLLALRMIESSNFTTFPSHALMIAPLCT